MALTLWVDAILKVSDHCSCIKKCEVQIHKRFRNVFRVWKDEKLLTAPSLLCTTLSTIFIASGYTGPWTRADTSFSNEYFRELVENKWTLKRWDGPDQFEDPTGDLMMLPTGIFTCSTAFGRVNDWELPFLMLIINLVFFFAFHRYGFAMGQGLSKVCRNVCRKRGEVLQRFCSCIPEAGRAWG